MKISNKSSLEMDLSQFIHVVLDQGQGKPIENIVISKVEPVPQKDAGKAGVVTVEFSYDLDLGEVKLK